MGPLAQFIIALTNLVRSGAIRKIPQAIKFAEQQFGKVTPLLKKQIEKVFESAKKPVVGKPGKKEGAVIPMVKEGAKKAEGIETLDDKGLTDSPLNDLKRIIEDSGGTAKTRDEILRDEMLKDTDPPKLDSKENIQLGIEKLKNPNRPGGSLDPALGITRALARRILNRKGIEIGKKDPIDVFTDTFGASINDVNNLAEEMIEIDARGGGMKDMDQMLEIEGLFDIEIPTNPQRGLTDDEMIEMLEKDVKEKEMLEDFDPTFRKPNAEGGLMRTKLAMGGDPLPEDPTKPINPFGPKPTGPVLPDKSMMASGYGSYKDFIESTGDEELMNLYIEGLNSGDFTKLFDALQRKGYQGRDDIATGGRVQAASGGLADILKV
jgi:hypothetical protein